MFLIHKERNIESLINFFIEELGIKDNKIFSYELGCGYKLSWSNIKPSDNLSIFKDGFVIGRTSFKETHSQTPIIRQEELIPSSINPLLHSIVIRVTTDDIIIRPNEQMPVYYSDKCVSDFSLLIAKAQKLLPSKESVAMLAATGFCIGNTSMFEEIRRITYLSELSLVSKQERPYDVIQLRKNDDQLMVDNILDAMPSGVASSISLSGGMDSRFMLGLLDKKGLKPFVYHIEGVETDIVKEICSTLELRMSTDNYPLPSDYHYTLRTDGRIYLGGGKYSRMVNDIKPDEFIFNGMFNLPILKNVYKTVWKDFRIQKSEVFEKIVEIAYLGYIGDQIEGLSMTKNNMKEFYMQKMAFIPQLTDITKKHELTRLFSHINRSLNWGFLTTADLSFYRYPLFPMGVKSALECGITSPLYANFNADRLRLINQKLFPQYPIDYGGNRPYHSSPFIIRDFKKIYKEYFKAFFTYMKDNKVQRSGSTQNMKADQRSEVSSNGFTEFFDNDLEAVLTASNIRKNTKRSAITLNNILLFLEKDVPVNGHEN